MLINRTRRAVRASLLLALPLTCSLARAQAPAWATAAAATPAPGTNTYIQATAADAGGNVYAAGYFTGAATFGSTSLTAAGATDGFVAKWSGSSQSWSWALRVGGPFADQITGLALNGSSLYVVGGYVGSVLFGNTLLNGGISNDAFVAKLIDAGSAAGFDWVERLGGAGDDLLAAVAVSGSSVYVAGRFESPSATFGNRVVTSAGSSDTFVGKLTDLGASADWVWGQGGGGSGADRATALAVRGSTVYAAGTFTGPGTFGSTTLMNAGGTDAFVARLNDSGTAAAYAWAQRGGGFANDQATALAVSGNGVFVGGTFPTVAFFGSISIGSNGTQGNDDGFVAKLVDGGASASWTWAQPLGGPFFDRVNALAASGSSLYVAGSYNGPAVFGPTTLTGFQEVFVAKIIDNLASGQYAWAAKGGAATGSDYGQALALAPPRVVVAGYFGGGPAAFDAFTLPNSAPATNVAFVATLLDPTLTAARAPAEAAVFTLSPNPAQGVATLAAAPAAVSRPVQVFDGLGRLRRTAVLPAHTGTISLALAALPAGLYVVRCAEASARLAVE